MSNLFFRLPAPVRLMLTVVGGAMLAVAVMFAIVVVYSDVTAPGMSQERPNGMATKVATTVILLGWIVGVPFVGMRAMCFAGGPRMAGIALGVLILLPTLAVLTWALSYANECNAGDGFPIQFEACH